MLIKSMQLENFRQFKGKGPKLLFSTDKEKNVTIFLGDNTSGKTSLLQAFRWCLYDMIDFTNSDEDLYNFELVPTMKKNEVIRVSVTIEIEHNNAEYKLFRYLDYVKYRDEKLEKRLNKSRFSIVEKKKSDGECTTYTGVDCDDIVSRIIPINLADYFFIDTERMNTVRGKKDIKSSIETILDLSGVKQAIDDLGHKNKKTSVIGMLYGDLNHYNTPDEDLLYQKAEACKKGIDTLIREIELAKKNGDKYTDLQVEARAKIQSYQDTITDVAKKEELKNKISRLEGEENQEVSKAANQYTANMFGMVAKEPIKKALAILNKHNAAKADSSLIWPEEILRDILQSHRCICGCEICESDELYIRAKKAFANSEEQEKLIDIKTLISKFEGMSTSNFELSTSLLDSIQRIYSIQSRRLKAQDKLNKLAVNENNEKEIALLQHQIDELKRHADKENQLYQIKLNDKRQKERELKGYQDRLEELKAQRSENEKTFKEIAYAEKLLEYFNKDYTNGIKNIREDLEKKVNDLFEIMYTGKRYVKIDEDYNTIPYASINGVLKQTEESEGLKRVLNFAFIAGLLSLAKDKVEKKGAGRLSSHFLSHEENVYPLVLDAPFSNTDKVHVQNIADVLPKVAEQIIMFVMEKDFGFAEDKLAGKIGKSYSLEKHSETYTSIRCEGEQ